MVCCRSVIDPIEIAADKLSAFCWRVNVKDRSEQHGTNKNDPKIIKHLHDLSYLEKHIFSDKELFKDLVIKSIDSDKGRG